MSDALSNVPTWWNFDPDQNWKGIYTTYIIRGWHEWVPSREKKMEMRLRREWILDLPVGANARNFHVMPHADDDSSFASMCTECVQRVHASIRKA